MDKAVRGVYRGQITRLAKAAQDYLALEDSQAKEVNAENFDAIEEELAVFLQRLTVANQSLREANVALRASIKPEEAEKESEEIAEYDDRATSITARLSQRIAKLRALQERFNGSVTLPASNQAHYDQRSAQRTCSAKLPKLSLRSFSGNLTDWLPFWEIFRTAVHERSELNATEKFNYLQAHLTGKAADSIRGLTPSEANYNEAITMLKEEYGDNEKVVDCMLQELMVLPRVTSSKDVSSLRKLYNRVTSTIRSLSSLGVPSTSYTVMLKSIILRCLPCELTVQFYRTAEVKSGEPSVTNDDSFSDACSQSSISCYGDQQLKELIRFLKLEVESLERTLQVQQRQRSSLSSQGNHQKTTSSLLTSNESGSNGNSNTNTACYFCKSNLHSTQNCNSSLTISQRKDMLKRDGRCYRCTRRGHSSKGCSVHVHCSKCRGKHATAICDPNFKNNAASSRSCKRPTNTSEKEEKEVKQTTTTGTTLYCVASQRMGNVFLQTASVRVAATNSSTCTSARIVLDGGSQRSYITSALAEKLDLRAVDTIKIRIQSFGSKCKMPLQTLERVRVVLKSRFSDQSITVFAIKVPSICIDFLPSPHSEKGQVSKYALADTDKIEGINVLIGADYYWRVVLPECERIDQDTVAVNTIFGWTIHGPSYELCENNVLFSTSSLLCAGTCTDACVERLWDLETIGISNDDKKVEFDYNDLISKVNGRYEAKLLWKKTHYLLQDNKNCALRRVGQLINKLLKYPLKFLEYDREMRELIADGIAERVDDIECPNCPVYYMPHRPVYREDKTTSKLRIVFDASSRTGENFSLNDMLSVGPNLLPNILKILVNFRLRKIALVADIAKAFLQISLAPQDRNAHRFLWFEKPIEDIGELPNIAVYRMARVTFGVACSPFILCATLQKHLAEEADKFEDTCKLLSRSFYMDDLVLSTDTRDSALKIYTESCIILSNASMELRKWNSNDRYVRKNFSKRVADGSQKILGLIWNVDADVLQVDLSDLAPSAPATKRNILSMLAKIYDPLGILGPFTVKLKVLFQEAWREKFEWDDVLPSSSQTIYKECVDALPLLSDFSILRCMNYSSERQNQQLHIFCDASPVAYGTVAYIRNIHKDGTVHVSYVCSKNRIAPLKQDRKKDLTLPKLELTAACIGSRLKSFLLNCVGDCFESIHLWTDSSIALNWILNDKRKLVPYVAHRVREIRQLTNEAEWGFCPGISNPADLLTRGISGRKLVTETTWLNGPTWLSESSDNWPILPLLQNNDNSIYLQAVVVEGRKTSGTPILNIEDFSRYTRLLRVTAYVFRFLEAIKGQRAKHRFLTSNEIINAERYWIKISQSEAYNTEITALKNAQGLFSSKIASLCPILDQDGIIRAHSRLQEGDFTFDEANPIILPKSAYLAKLIISDAHERTIHGGINATLNRVRERFWIVKGRQSVKSSVQKCCVCRRLRGKPMSQPFAPLPRCRLSTSKPFETTGVDFAGPLYVRTLKEDHSTTKVYVMICTCAVIRAVHLELVQNLTTECCIAALRRFFSRRGIPKTIISDNARTFRRASKESELNPRIFIISCHQTEFGGNL